MSTGGDGLFFVCSLPTASRKGFFAGGLAPVFSPGLREGILDSWGKGLFRLSEIPPVLNSEEAGEVSEDLLSSEVRGGSDPGGMAGLGFPS